MMQQVREKGTSVWWEKLREIKRGRDYTKRILQQARLYLLLNLHPFVLSSPPIICHSWIQWGGFKESSWNNKPMFLEDSMPLHRMSTRFVYYQSFQNKLAESLKHKIGNKNNYKKDTFFSQIRYHFRIFMLCCRLG